jgi:hypothetical protein
MFFVCRNISGRTAGLSRTLERFAAFLAFAIRTNCANAAFITAQSSLFPVFILVKNNFNHVRLQRLLAQPLIPNLTTFPVVMRLLHPDESGFAMTKALIPTSWPE